MFGRCARLRQRGLEIARAGGIGGMDDAPVAVAAFAGQVELESTVFGAGLFIAGERHALVDQPARRPAGPRSTKPHRVLVDTAPRRRRGCRRQCDSILSEGSSTAEIPPWAYRVLPSVMGPLARTATVQWSASCSASRRPAAPLPITKYFAVDLLCRLVGVGECGSGCVRCGPVVTSAALHFA